MDDWTRQIKGQDELIDGLEDCEIIDNIEEENIPKNDGEIDIEFVDELESTELRDDFKELFYNKDKSSKVDEIPKFRKPVDLLEDEDLECTKDESTCKDELTCTRDELPYPQDESSCTKEELDCTKEKSTCVKEEDNSDEEGYLYINKEKHIQEDDQEINPQPNDLELNQDDEESSKKEALKEQMKWGMDLGEFAVKKNSNNEEEDLEEDSPIKIESEDESEPIDIPIIQPEVAVDEENIDIDIVKPKDFKELIGQNGVVLENYISGDAKFNSTSENLHVCIQLCKLFASVHSLGACFNGITASDIIITQNRECKIIDDKKIVSAGDDNYQVNYEKTCAPEILRKEAKPSVNADKHSMAFLLFGLLFKSDPFEGAEVLNTPCYSKNEEIKYYENPVFVYSYEDKSNLPVYGIHSVLIKYWNRFYPDGIKMAFKQSFVDGVEDPSIRVDEMSFIEVLTKFKAVIDSKNTKKEPENIKDNKKKNIFDKLQKLKPEKNQDIDISKDFEQKPKVIEINKDIPKKPEDTSIPKYQLCTVFKYVNEKNRDSIILELSPGVEILNNLVGYEDVNKRQVIGKVVQNSKHKGVLGIKNMSNHEWLAAKGNEIRKFPPGKVVVISNGVKIDFYPENKSSTKNEWNIRQV